MIKKRNCVINLIKTDSVTQKNTQLFIDIDMFIDIEVCPGLKKVRESGNGGPKEGLRSIGRFR